MSVAMQLWLRLCCIPVTAGSFNPAKLNSIAMAPPFSFSSPLKAYPISFNGLQIRILYSLQGAEHFVPFAQGHQTSLLTAHSETESVLPPSSNLLPQSS
ncbi:hypothetical protein BU23DRAFT_541017 [Bimuria novae-zelandiae CBS 107.79]|uniref:Secreted protein n=1 Tax=Bimuria novae-zelandiae CBS 107.79 TaxID=1447943 RepID=A0A6A5UUY0_9PLEO|nr:hypothetical protein BU23DRAFT_541017 [Bimuria novae-zelandiae CBS 107.79]